VALVHERASPSNVDEVKDGKDLELDHLKDWVVLEVHNSHRVYQTSCQEERVVKERPITV